MADFHRLYKKFSSRIGAIESRALSIQLQIGRSPSWHLRSLTETMVSDTWQLWCVFCRNLLLSSCEGGHSRKGAPVIARRGDNSWKRVGYEAVCAFRGNKPKPTKVIGSLYQEPTWGDQDKLIDIVGCLSPSNSVQLLTAFGLPLRGPKHLQIVRNACAHKHRESISKVLALEIYFVSPKLFTPSDIVWQVEASSGNLGMYAWLDDLQVIAGEATR